MTIKVPPLSIFDKFLYFIGKTRGVFIPTKVHSEYGQHVYAISIKESFWKALLRPKGVDLPENMFDISEHSKEHRKE